MMRSPVGEPLQLRALDVRPLLLSREDIKDRSKPDLNGRRWSFEAPSSVIYEAVVEGHLEVLQFLKDHADASSLSLNTRESTSGDGAGHSEIAQEAVRRALGGAIKRGHYDVVRWVYENGHSGEGREGETLVDAKVVCRAMDCGGTELAEAVILPDNVVEKGTTYRLRDELVGPLLECCRDGDCAARAMRSLAILGRLDLMQQVAQLHPPSAQDAWSSDWQYALERAAQRGDVPMLQWLMDRSYWRGLEVDLAKLRVHEAFSKAAEGGSIAAMEYLHSHELAGDDRSIGVMEGPVRSGRLDAVKWLLEHGWRLEMEDARGLIRVAAEYGHLDILQLFQDRLGRDVYSQQTADLSSAILHGRLAVVQWVHANRPEQNWAVFSGIAAFRGHLDVLQWLYENRLCELVDLHFPAGCGRFEVVRWMLSVEPELSVSGLLDSAEPGDNMELVQWLHDNTRASCTTNAIDFAARNGNLTFLKWLHAHRSEGCTTKAIDYALGLDDIRVASWLVKHFQNLVPQGVELKCQLEVLLFVRWHFPHLLRPEAFRQGTTKLDEAGIICSDDVRAWLKENYGGQTLRTTDGREITL
jgi:hypothetical protein